MRRDCRGCVSASEWCPQKSSTSSRYSPVIFQMNGPISRHGAITLLNALINALVYALIHALIYALIYQGSTFAGTPLSPISASVIARRVGTT